MFVPFDVISPDSRIWIYQAERKFTAPEKTQVESFLNSFMSQWAAHGQALEASFDIPFDQFIVIAANESYHAASGCSIDDLFRAVKEIEARIGCDLFNRNLVGFKKDDSVEMVPLAALKQKFREGVWNQSTLTFNNLVATRGQLHDQWIVPASETWLKRYMSGEKVVH